MNEARKIVPYLQFGGINGAIYNTSGFQYVRNINTLAS